MNITGVDKAIQQLQSLVSQTKISAAINALADDGVRQAKNNLDTFTFFNEPKGLRDSIHKETVSQLEVAVVADGGYASFVEYGTGIRGKNSPHPEVPTGWVYDVNEHGEAGWWYPTDKQPPEGQPQRYDSNKGIWFAWTRGLDSRPFMYRTAQDIEAIAKATIKSALGSK